VARLAAPLLQSRQRRPHGLELIEQSAEVFVEPGRERNFELDGDHLILGADEVDENVLAGGTQRCSHQLEPGSCRWIL